MSSLPTENIRTIDAHRSVATRSDRCIGAILVEEGKLTPREVERVLERQRQAALAGQPLSQQLEVETYTWDVLPAEQRAGGVVASIARELGWVQARLEPAEQQS